MKRLLSLILALYLLMSCSSAMAAGKLELVQTAYVPIQSWTHYLGYVAAEVTNTGNQNVELETAILELFKADNTLFNSYNIYSMSPSVLAPGQTGYISSLPFFDGVKSLKDIQNYDLSVTGRSTYMEAPLYFPASIVSENFNEETKSFSAVVSVTNNTDDIIYGLYVSFAVYDKDNKLLYTDCDHFLNIGVPAGVTVEIDEIVTNFLEPYWLENDIIPGSVKVSAFMFPEE